MKMQRQYNLLLYQIAKFIITGIANTSVGLFTIYILMIVGVNYIVSNIIGYTIGITISFYFNRFWTFSYQSKKWVFDLIRFLIIIIVSYSINLSLVISLVEIYSIQPYLAQIAGIFVYTIVSFAGMKTFVFVSERS